MNTQEVDSAFYDLDRQLFLLQNNGALDSEYRALFLADPAADVKATIVGALQTIRKLVNWASQVSSHAYPVPREYGTEQLQDIHDNLSALAVRAGLVDERSDPYDEDYEGAECVYMQYPFDSVDK